MFIYVYRYHDSSRLTFGSVLFSLDLGFYSFHGWVVSRTNLTNCFPYSKNTDGVIFFAFVSRPSISWAVQKTPLPISVRHWRPSMRSNISNTLRHSLISTIRSPFRSVHAVHAKTTAVSFCLWTVNACVCTLVQTMDNWKVIKLPTSSGQRSDATVWTSNISSSNTSVPRWKWRNQSNYKPYSPCSCMIVSSAFCANCNSPTISTHLLKEIVDQAKDCLSVSFFLMCLIDINFAFIYLFLLVQSLCLAIEMESNLAFLRFFVLSLSQSVISLVVISSMNDCIFNPFFFFCSFCSHHPLHICMNAYPGFCPRSTW